MNKILTIPFPEPFIQRLADHIHGEYIVQGKDLRRLAVVFGGHRPILFLKRELARRVKGSFFPPQGFSIDEFISAVTVKEARQGLLDLDHCFVMYQLAQAHAPQVLKGREEFVSFLPWAREILRFIEQLDLEDAPADALKVLRAHAAIGFDVPVDINRLLEALMVLRQKYHAYLDAHQMASRGYRYLRASRMIADVSFDAYDQILFCNFFYLHHTEMAVMRNLFERGKATLYLQGDQRRWPALLRIAKDFGQEVLEGAQVAPVDFKLHIYAALDMHTQAGVVAQILKGIPDVSKTVIVLPNPDFILVLLSAISATVTEFNISMGYPLKRSSLYALLTAIVTAHSTMKGSRYYTRDYLRVLRHPLVKSLRLECPSQTVGIYIQLLEDILTGAVLSPLSGQIFVDIEDILLDELLFERAVTAAGAMGIEITIPALRKVAEDVHTQFFSSWKGLATFADLAVVLERFCLVMEEHSGLSRYPFNDRVAGRLQIIAAEWRAAKFCQESFARGDLLGIMLERLGHELVAFSGSPLKGLQVLGLVETRSLSFEQVIIVDVNERVLPNLNIYEPLIPREVMIKMNLDRVELEEEIQRYQFMRLVSNARDVFLIYQERVDKERSRFIEELVWEREQKAGETGVVDVARPSFTVALKESRLVVPKTAQIVEFLKGFRFSASSVNTYLRNPYEFYQNYVLGLRDKEDLLDDPQGRQVGTFIHNLLEEVFKPMIGRKPVIDTALRRRFRDLFESGFHQAFGKGLRSDAFLTKAVLENRLNFFLDQEAARVDLEVAQLLFIERRFEDQVPLSCGPVNFSYRLDRVDRLEDGTILVLDYKTGSRESMPGEWAPQMELSRELLRDRLGSFQMPLYLRYLDEHYPNHPVNCGLYYLRTMEMVKLITAKTSTPRPLMISNFVKCLDFLMCEIFNPEIPFTNDPLDIN